MCERELERERTHSLYTRHVLTEQPKSRLQRHRPRLVTARWGQAVASVWLWRVVLCWVPVPILSSSLFSLSFCCFLLLLYMLSFPPSKVKGGGRSGLEKLARFFFFYSAVCYRFVFPFLLFFCLVCFRFLQQGQARVVAEWI